MNQYLNNEKDSVRNPTNSDAILPKVNSKIVYYNPDILSWNETLILIRAGKSTGKKNTWFNITNLEDQSQSVEYANNKRLEKC